MKYPRKDLDEIDYAILDLLQADGRMSLSELGRQIGMSPVAVSDRIARMTDMGVIEGFTVSINKERMGLPTHAFMITDLVPPEKRREFDATIASIPQIIAYYHVMSGGKEAILNIYCRDYDQLIDLQTKLARIVTYSTFIVEPQPRKEIIVSRGELVEIGGAFRIPDIMEQSGAYLKEVGTSNKTKPSDYETAIMTSEMLAEEPWKKDRRGTLRFETGALMKVHKSNYDILGFTEEASLEDLVAIGKKHNLPVIFDMGNGLMLDMSEYGLREPNVPA